MAELADGRRVFVKTHPRAPRTMFGAEARGLGWLREAGALRIPEVLAVSDDDAEGPLFLALEYIESRPAASGFDEAAGAWARRAPSVRRAVASGSITTTSSAHSSRRTGLGPLGPLSSASNGSSRSYVARPSGDSSPRRCAAFSTDCSIDSNRSSGLTSRLPVCTAIYGAATSTPTIEVRLASSTLRSTAGIAKSISP